MGDTSDDRDTDDEREYEDARGSRLLEFMFVNVDNSGELDVYYLDEDEKEHLDALAIELEPALTTINFPGKSSRNGAALVEEGYYEKAACAVDYEDIEEQYEGPEVEPTTEEDHLLPKSEYRPADVLETAREHKSSVSPQLKSISEKQTVHGVKILHSKPGLKLQTMKPKMSKTVCLPSCLTARAVGAEECEETEEDNLKFKPEKCDAVRGLKTRKHSSQAQLEDEFEDEAAEADDEVQWKRKKKEKPAMMNQGFQNPELKKKNIQLKQKTGLAKPGDPFSPKQTEAEPYVKSTPSIKVKPAKRGDAPLKKSKVFPNGVVKKERKPARENYLCGACHQEGHMRTNKNCPRYGKDPEVLSVHTPGPEKSNLVDPSSQSHQKLVIRIMLPKKLTKGAPADAKSSESDKLNHLRV